MKVLALTIVVIVTLVNIMGSRHTRSSVISLKKKKILVFRRVAEAAGIQIFLIVVKLVFLHAVYS